MEKAKREAEMEEAQREAMQEKKQKAAAMGEVPLSLPLLRLQVAPTMAHTVHHALCRFAMPLQAALPHFWAVKAHLLSDIGFGCMPAGLGVFAASRSCRTLMLNQGLYLLSDNPRSQVQPLVFLFCFAPFEPSIQK